MRAGSLDKLIVVERGTVTTDGYGGEVIEWSPYCTEPASVTYGKGSERREAAQQSATIAATFRIRSNPTTNAITVTDRIAFDGGTWDVSSNVPYLREGRDITAIRNV